MGRAGSEIDPSEASMPLVYSPVVVDFLDNGVDQISLGDTSGRSTPKTVEDVLRTISQEFSLSRFALHYHVKRQEELEGKVSIGYELGIRTFDSAAGGIGGCPTDPDYKNIDTLRLL